MTKNADQVIHEWEDYGSTLYVVTYRSIFSAEWKSIAGFDYVAGQDNRIIHDTNWFIKQSRAEEVAKHVSSYYRRLVKVERGGEIVSLWRDGKQVWPESSDD